MRFSDITILEKSSLDVCEQTLRHTIFGLPAILFPTITQRRMLQAAVVFQLEDR